MARGRMPGAACLAAALIFCLFLAWAVPYSPIDDMQWGLDEPGLRWWLTGALNGRYVGNFFAVILSRSQLVKTLVMGLGLFALPLLTALLAARGEGGRFLPAFLLGGLGLLLIPPALWQEVGGWVSGFGNYGVPSALFLAWLLLLRHGAGRRGRTGLWGAALFLVTLALGLFTENLTVLMLAAGVLAAGWGLRQRRQLGQRRQERPLRRRKPVRKQLPRRAERRPCGSPWSAPTRPTTGPSPMIPTALCPSLTAMSTPTAMM